MGTLRTHCGKAGVCSPEGSWDGQVALWELVTEVLPPLLESLCRSCSDSTGSQAPWEVAVKKVTGPVLQFYSASSYQVGNLMY